MKITQHTEGYNITLEAGEELEIYINGNPAKTWTVQANMEGQFTIKFNEEVTTP